MKENMNERENEQDVQLENLIEWYDMYSQEVLRGYCKEKRVRMDIEKVVEAMPSYTRRPFYTIRGRKITPQQARKLIIAEEPLFHGWEQPETDQRWDDREERGILRNILYRPGYSWLNSWLFTDGTIGYDSLTLAKYPTVDEFIPQWIDLGLKYDFLDMVISLTDYEERPCAFCGIIQQYEDEESEQETCPSYNACKQKFASLLSRRDFHEEERELLESWEKPDQEAWDRLSVKSRFRMGIMHTPEDYNEHICLAIRLRNGKVDVVTGQEAVDLSVEYDELYGEEKGQLFYNPDYYEDTVNTICSKKYIMECFEEIGLDGAEAYQYSVEHRFISDIPDNLFVVNGVQD